MANYQLNWTPASFSTKQKVHRIIRYNDAYSIPWTQGAVLLPTDNSYLWTGLFSNIAYKFRVSNHCLPTDGGGPPVYGNTYEWLEFECPTSLNLINLTSTTAEYSTTLTPNGGLEGGPNPPFYSTDITNVEYSLYNAANNTLISGPTLGNVTTQESTILFTGLAPNTTYTIRYVLLATVNGTSIRSDQANQLNTYCSQQITTQNAPSYVCCTDDLVITNASGNLGGGLVHDNVTMTNISFTHPSIGTVVHPTFNNATDYLAADGTNPISQSGIGPVIWNYGDWLGQTFCSNNGSNYKVTINIDTSFISTGSSGEPLQLRVVDGQGVTQIIPYSVSGPSNFTFNNVAVEQLVGSPLNCGVKIYLEAVPPVPTEFSFTITGEDTRGLGVAYGLFFIDYAGATIDWGDGTTSISVAGENTHIYPDLSPRTITVTNILGDVTGLGFYDMNNDITNGVDSFSIDEIKNTITEFNSANNRIFGNITIDLPNCTILNLVDNSIDGLQISSLASCTDFYIINNKIPTTDINNALIYFESIWGVGANNFQSESQTPPAPPTGLGLIAKNNLIAKGHTVVTD